MVRLVRKQILLERRQDEALKRLAERTGKSEGALVSEAIDLALARAEDADAQWEALLQRWAAAPPTGGQRTWRREDIHHQRLARYDDNPR